VFGNISTDICTVTAQHSLFPVSDTCTAMGWSHDQLSQSLESYTSLPRSEARAWWVRRLLSTEGLIGYGRTHSDFFTYPLHRFGSGVSAISPVDNYDLCHRFTYVRHTTYLAFTCVWLTGRYLSYD